jgi:hypothetical protein
VYISVKDVFVSLLWQKVKGVFLFGGTDYENFTEP